MQLLQRIITSLQQEFSMKDLGELHHFLGMSVHRSKDQIVLSQWLYTLDILERTGMMDCKPYATPVDTCAKVSSTAGTPDPTAYRSLVGAL